MVNINKSKNKFMMRAIKLSIKNVKTGEKYNLNADYLVACDGGKSGIREKLNIIKVYGMTETCSGTVYLKLLKLQLCIKTLFLHPI